MPVHHLDEQQVFKHVHAPAAGALHSDAGGLGGGILAVRRGASGFADAAARLVGQHLRRGEDLLRGDTQSPAALFVGEDAQHRGVGNQPIRMPVVQPADDHLEAVRSRQAESGCPPGTSGCTNLSRHLPGIDGGDHRNTLATQGAHPCTSPVLAAGERRQLLARPMLSLAISLPCTQQLQEESCVLGTTLLADPLVKVYTVQRN